MTCKITYLNICFKNPEELCLTWGIWNSAYSQNQMLPPIMEKIFSGGSVVKNLPTNAGDASSIPELRRSPGKGNGNPLQYSCLGNPIDRGAWWATVHRVTKELSMTKQQQQCHGNNLKCWNKSLMYKNVTFLNTFMIIARTFSTSVNF